MKLDLTQIKKITFGAERILEMQNGFLFRRMPEKIETAFANHREIFLKRARSTSAVRLDFYTDSEFVNFEYSDIVDGAPGVFYSFDVYLDDKLVYTHFDRSEKSPCGKFTLSLEKPARVRIFFPNLTAPLVSRIELSDGCKITPFSPELNILCYGDSITQGYFALCPSNSYVNRIADALCADVRNIGVGAGHFFADAVERFENFDPDIVTVAYGTNDWNGDRVLFEPRCEQFMKKLSQTFGDKKVFVILPIWREDYKEIKEKTGDFFSHCDFIRKNAERYGFCVIDGLSLMPHDTALCFGDGLHPNDAGFAHYAQNLLKRIKDCNL